MSLKNLKNYDNYIKGLPQVNEDADPIESIKSDIAKTWTDDETIQNDVANFLKAIYQANGEDGFEKTAQAILGAINYTRENFE